MTRRRAIGRAFGRFEARGGSAERSLPGHLGVLLGLAIGLVCSCSGPAFVVPERVVLLSIDTDRTDMSPERRFLPERAEDRDFPMSWIKTYGKGRVFYTSFGHNTHMYQDRTLLGHYLAGIQYALGDLEADATPSALTE